MKQKCILIITDGIGYNKDDKFNAFANAKKPNYDKFFEEIPNTLIKTSGLAVGLPDGQMGNSEVGHMCIGSGQIIYQNLVKINKAIKDNTLEKNENLNNILKKSKKVHIVGLYSDGGVHSHLDHFNAMLKICKDKNKEVFAHAITDGRDVSPSSGIEFIKNLQNFCDENDVKLASLSGRFYAMDRDKRWDRTKKYFDALSGIAPKKTDFLAYIKDSYENNTSDEFIEPVIDINFNGIDKEDVIIFINFRNDRMKQIVSAFYDDNFKEFERKNVFKNIISMSVYDDKFDFPVLFEKENIKYTLASVISNANLRQLHTAETEKYAHVTFFFNGGKEDVLENETRILVPSPKVKTYDEIPQMSAYEVLEVVKDGIKNDEDFIVVNFANGDMVGHSGNYEASIKAVEVIDNCLGEIVKEARKKNYAFIITSDHGNCEAMKDENDKILTNHTNYDVFVFVEAKGVSKLKENKGLSSIAASVLKIMGLEIPSCMDEALF